MKTLKTYLTVFTLAFFCFMLSCPAALAANLVIDDDAQPAVSGLYLTSNYKDDAACIQAALDNSKSGDTITIREGDYYITKRIYQKDKSLTIIGEGEVTLHLQTAEGVHNGLFFEGSQITTLTATAYEGSYQVALSDGSQVRAGDLLKIWKGDLWCPEDYPKQMTGEVYLVKSVSRNTVTLTESLIRDYPDASVIVYRPVEIHIENLNIQDCGSTTTHEAITLLYCINSSVSDCNIRDSGFAGISFYCSFNVKAYDNDVRNCIKAGSGYGIGIWSGTAHSEVYSNYLVNCRHCITLNSDRLDTLIRDAHIHHNDCTGGTIPGSLVIDAHPIAIDWIVEYNEIKAQSGYYALNDGALISTFSNNKVYGGYGAVIRRGSVNGGSHIIKDNVIEGTSDSFTYRAWGSGKGETLVITNNSQSAGRYGVYLSSEQPESFRNIIISGNRFSNILNQGVYQKFLINGVNLEISNNIFENIGREGIYIDGNYFKNGNVKIQNNVLIKVYPSSPGSGITIKNIQNALVSGNQIFETQVSKVPVAAFSASSTSGNAPLNVAFTDTSTGSPTAWNWNFGDGTINSMLQNPTHTYSIAGNYTVTLTASNAAGSNTVTWTAHVKSPEESVPEEPVVSEIKASDNRLREASPETVFQETPFIDVGGMNSLRYRDVAWFNLSEYVDSAEINSATLSLYWYYPEGSSRPEDTVIEVYRPASTWNSSYVSWNKRDKDIAWNNAGGDWYDNNCVLQGSAPYATITLKGSEIPDNRYYELDVTDLVKEYASGKYENTGFLIKARTESNNYIAFYSSNCGNESQKPKLNVTKKVPVVIENVIVTGAKDNRLKEAFPKTVFQDRPYIDIGGIDIGGIDYIGRYRDVMWFNLSEYAGSEINSATLSLYWYYPAESRPGNTVVEVYRPSSWNPDYVSWNKRDSGIAWKNPGGDWYDKNGVSQGSTPYATITINGSTLPDNRYYELNVTDLVKEYNSEKYENTGFLIKARTESNNYIAFYSSDCGNESQVPKLQLIYS